MPTIVIGGDHVGLSLAQRLSEADVAVTFVDGSARTTERARQANLPTATLDPADAFALEDAGLDPPRTVVVATDRDRRNLLIAQLVRLAFDPERVVVRVNDPENRDLFDDLDVETLCTSTLLARALASLATTEPNGPTDDTLSELV